MNVLADSIEWGESFFGEEGRALLPTGVFIVGMRYDTEEEDVFELLEDYYGVAPNAAAIRYVYASCIFGEIRNVDVLVLNDEATEHKD